MIELIGVSKTFNKTVAVDRLDLEIPAGSIFGLLGPNGAGKTTTIRMIMNIIRPDSGEIRIGGKFISDEIYRRVGYLPEERGLYQKTKLKETIVYLATLKGLSRSEAAQQTDYYLNKFDLTNYAERKIEELSKGNQQKVQFIISVIHQPEIIILDEPFAGLDPVNQLLLKQIIAEFQADGKTVLFSAHQMEQIEKLCSRICLINAGKRILYGDLKEIKDNYSVKKFKIQFEGEKSKLADLIQEGWIISDSVISGNLSHTTEINDILKKIIARVTVTHVDIEEPSLEQIFIDLVKGESDQ
jgi:ABC-2 type transport system ATP-binding protein